MSVRVRVLILCIWVVAGDVALRRFVPECNVCCGFVVVMVLYVLGDTLKMCGPVQGVCWWRCWWIDPHGDEAVGRALLIVIDE